MSNNFHWLLSHTLAPYVRLFYSGRGWRGCFYMPPHNGYIWIKRTNDGSFIIDDDIPF